MENITHFTSPPGSRGTGTTDRSESQALSTFVFCSLPLFSGGRWESVLTYKVQLQNLPPCLQGSKASPVRYQDGDSAI